MMNDPSSIAMFAKEVRLMKSLNHRNVLKCLGFFIKSEPNEGESDESGKNQISSSSSLNIITEFVDGGSLYDLFEPYRTDLICKEKDLRLEMKKRLKMILDIARFGLKFFLIIVNSEFFIYVDF